MEKIYKIEVDCPACAAKVEKAIKKTEGVKDAVVNFIALKLKIVFEEDADTEKVLKEVIKNGKKAESDFELFL